MADPQHGTADRVDDVVLLDVLARVSEGDFTARMPHGWTGVAGKVADRLNDVIAANASLCLELERIGQVVGKEGRLSERVNHHGPHRAWAGTTASINTLIDDLVRPTSEMQRVIGAVADGDLSKKITVDAGGEMLALKNTINAMVDQLNRFASEVTRVAREVGVEGRLGGQAQSAEVAGVWKDLTDNVNQLAANLTNQVRAIADVATAVTEGDLTRQVGVEASGEVAVLKDKLNEMIRNLRETTRQNTEQDWLKTHLESFTHMLQGQRDLATVSAMILTELAPLVGAQHGVLYVVEHRVGEVVLRHQAGYGDRTQEGAPRDLRLGEGLVGQAARDKRRILLTDVPAGYVRINSGLGEATPLNLVVLPILFEGTVRAVLELASFSAFSETHQAFLGELTERIGLVLNTVEANTVTETLLAQAQTQAQELQARQEELRGSNEDLGRQASRLAEQNLEVELAKRLVEEKAEQLAVSSNYKSEFFSNMSHELRTPLNSLLILARELETNPDGNLTADQVQYASVIHSSGTDLLRLLNDILDLAKVESGTVTLELAELALVELQDALEREFRPVAEQKDIAFAVTLAPDLPESMRTDPGRLRQVLKNVLSNAFKFTEFGEVRVEMTAATEGWSAEHERLGQAEAVIAFRVSDTGIGINEDKQQRMFEAFAQADGTTARQYGGTGLGLSISRELVRLLGGEIALESAVGEGSTFTIFLPAVAGDPGVPVATPRRAPAAEPVAPAVVTRASPPALGGKLAGRTALVIDDDFRNVFALTTLLERGQLEVVSAESGEAGLELLRDDPEIDIALVDIMMPIMDGYATIRAMRRLPRGAELPIIAFTANVAPGERQRCLDAGASAYIAKPVDTAELLLTLVDWLPAQDAGAAAPVGAR